MATNALVMATMQHWREYGTHRKFGGEKGKGMVPGNMKSGAGDIRQSVKVFRLRVNGAHWKIAGIKIHPRPKKNPKER